MWSDNTFIFTAYTGLAASLFGGVTISKAAFLTNANNSALMTEMNGRMYELL
jgi:hypothetical protein